MNPDENLLATDLKVDEAAVIHLRESSKWARFLGIMGMLISLLLALAGIFLPLFLDSLPTRYGSGSYRDSATLFGIGFLAVFYVIIAVIFFFISIFLFHFGAKMKKALQYTDQELFNESLLNLKRYYRVMGIITIIYLSFLALALLFGLIGALFSR